MLFPHVRQQLTNKMKEGHRQASEERDAAVALLNDDLQKHEDGLINIFLVMKLL